MSRIAARFAHLQRLGEKALVCYLTAGDPPSGGFVKAALAAIDGGADLLEIGVPFSDPMADGPSIQASSQRALESGATVDGALAAAAAVHGQRPDVPLIAMTYYNPVRKRGVARFAADARAAGIDGVIVTDLTPEEADPWLEAAREAGLDTIFLVAPTSTPARIEAVAGICTGFVYCVSRTGVTGAREQVPADLPGVVARIRDATATPVCVGFGISRPEHVRAVCAFADGAVVGSALVDLAHRRRSDGTLSGSVREYVHGLKAAAR